MVAATLCLLGCQSGREARRAAATAAIEQALEIQPLLEQTRACPADLKGWTPDSRHPYTPSIRLESALLRFDCDEQRQTFSITVTYAFDAHVYVVGPFEGPLHIQYGHFTAAKTKVIPANPNVPELAELLAFGS
jgi:hypothetical protein